MQCQCLKQDGHQCHRGASSNSLYCWQHQIYCPNGPINPKMIKQVKSTHRDPLVESYKKPELTRVKSKSALAKSSHNQAASVQTLSSNSGSPIKLLGEGSYGCIFYPPLPCKNNPELNNLHEGDVMKVITSRDNSRDIEVSKAIRRIDSYETYFIPLSADHCQIKMDAQALSECGLYKKGHIDQLEGHFMKHGGRTLDKYIYFESPPIQTIYQWFRHLMIGLEILMKSEIIHMDIRLDNIMVRDGSSPKLIDFGLAFFADSVKNLPALQLSDLYPLFYSVLMTNEIEPLYDMYEFYLPFYYSDYKKGGQHDLIKQLFDESRQPQKYRNTFWSNRFKIDVYLLARVFNDILNVDRDRYEKEDPILTSHLTELIKLCLHPDPNRQYDATECLKKMASYQT